MSGFFFEKLGPEKKLTKKLTEFSSHLDDYIGATEWLKNQKPIVFGPGTGVKIGQSAPPLTPLEKRAMSSEIKASTEMASAQKVSLQKHDIIITLAPELIQLIDKYMTAYNADVSNTEKLNNRTEALKYIAGDVFVDKLAKISEISPVFKEFSSPVKSNIRPGGT